MAELAVAIALQTQPHPPSLEPLYRQTLSDRERKFGPGHVKVGASLVDLALFLDRNGNSAAAEPLLIRARAIFQGKDSDGLATVLAKLADIAGEGPRALELLRESLVARPAYPTASRLADLYQRAGDLDQAEACYRRAVELARDLMETASASNNLGLVVEEQGRVGEAESLFAKAVSLYEKGVGRDHPEFATALVNLAGTVRARGDLQTAAGMLRNAHRTLHATLGAAHPHTKAACEALTATLRQAGDSEAAQRGCNLSAPNTPIQ